VFPPRPRSTEPFQSSSMFISRPKATDSEYRTESFGTPSHTQSMFASPRLQSTEHMLQSARP
jgi:hypothetical protein